MPEFEFTKAYFERAEPLFPQPSNDASPEDLEEDSELTALMGAKEAADKSAELMDIDEETKSADDNFVYRESPSEVNTKKI